MNHNRVGLLIGLFVFLSACGLANTQLHLGYHLACDQKHDSWVCTSEEGYDNGLLLWCDDNGNSQVVEAALGNPQMGSCEAHSEIRSHRIRCDEGSVVYDVCDDGCNNCWEDPCNDFRSMVICIELENTSEVVECNEHQFPVPYEESGYCETEIENGGDPIYYSCENLSNLEDVEKAEEQTCPTSGG